MNNFFATPEGAWGDGSVHLTTAGIILMIAAIAALLIVAAAIRHRSAAKKAALTTKQLVYSAAAIALAVVCSMIKLFEMPMGGSVTLLSMLFIVLIAYWYGPGSVRDGTDLLHDPADAFGLSAGLWRPGTRRFFS